MGSLEVSAPSASPARVSVIASLKPWGGIEGKLVTLFHEFIARGVTPEFVCLRGGQVPYPERMPDGVSIVHLPTRSKRDGIPAVARYLRTTRPDAVLTAKDHAAQVTLLARLYGRVRVPVYVKVTNTLDRVARRRLQRWLIRRLYPRADGIIANSTGVADDLVASFGIERQRIGVIYNPTVSSDLRARSQASVEHPWFERASVPVILGVGRLTPQKDFGMLLRAFASVRQRRACRLVILGDGPERGCLEQQARELGVVDDLDMPGFVPDALPYMARANVFALSSRYEGLSNVMIEALASGTAVVATDCPSGSAEILDNGRYGRLVDVGDHEAMAQAIVGELDTPTAGRVLDEAVERFRAGPVAEQYLRFLGIS